MAQFKGKYTVTSDGGVLESENIVTVSGENLIRRVLSGVAPTFVKSLAVGVGNTAAADTDTELDFEFSRFPVTHATLAGNELIFKASVPNDQAFVGYELGAFSYETNANSGNYTNATIAEFITSESWQSAEAFSFDDTSSRIGGLGLVVTTSGTYSLSTGQFDLSGYSNDDVFRVALNCTTSALVSVTLVFSNDRESVGYQWTSGLNSSGYKILSATKGDFGDPAVGSTGGAFDWLSVNNVSVVIDTGANSVLLDGIRVFDSDVVDQDSVLVSRSIPASPIVKRAGVDMDIEYRIEIIV